MVATSGHRWRLAPSLIQLVKETDKLYPSRSIASDGSFGDPAHAARGSDHNPKSPRPPGFVDAVDLTDDDMHGCNVQTLIDHLVATRDPRVKYLIHNGRIWKSYPNRGYAAFQPQPYTGPNPHRLHAHISIVPEGRFDLLSWWPPKTKPTPPPTSPVQEDIDMLIVTCPGQSTRLLAPPVCPVIDGATIKSLSDAGVKVTVWEKDDYDALLVHVEDALGR